MHTSRQQFMEDNQDALNAYYLKADTKCQPVFGFGANSPKEALKAVLEDADEFYLPVCFLYIFWENADVESRDFVLQSLENLYWVDDKGQVTDPTMAYVYSYCLLQTDKETESFDVLKILSDQCFPPALVSMGDGSIANKNIADALDWYQHAMDHGYLTVIGRRNTLIFRNLSFPKNILFKPSTSHHFIRKMFNFLKFEMKGENILYLDFYNISHHLGEYWKTPKEQRIQDFKKEAALLCELSHKQETA